MLDLPVLIHIFDPANIIVSHIIAMICHYYNTFPDFRELCPEPRILQYCKASFAISETNFCAANDIKRMLKECIHTKYHHVDF